MRHNRDHRFLDSHLRDLPLRCIASQAPRIPPSYRLFSPPRFRSFCRGTHSRVQCVQREGRLVLQKKCETHQDDDTWPNLFLGGGGARY